MIIIVVFITLTSQSPPREITDIRGKFKGLTTLTLAPTTFLGNSQETTFSYNKDILLRGYTMFLPRRFVGGTLSEELLKCPVRLCPGCPREKFRKSLEAPRGAWVLFK